VKEKKAGNQQLANSPKEIVARNATEINLRKIGGATGHVAVDMQPPSRAIIVSTKNIMSARRLLTVPSI
jgi:ribosomal protein S7